MHLDILCNENQLDALLIFNSFCQSTSTCFGHVYCPSSGGIHCICMAVCTCYTFKVIGCWLDQDGTNLHLHYTPRRNLNSAACVVKLLSAGALLKITFMFIRRIVHMSAWSVTSSSLLWAILLFTGEHTVEGNHTNVGHVWKPSVMRVNLTAHQLCSFRWETPNVSLVQPGFYL
jgi:hypothetical protein